MSEPARVSPGGALSARMATLRRTDTRPELVLRRELHRRGLRYRLQQKVPGNNRRTIDIAFPYVRVAVFVDGCFWHGCPDHGTQPSTNSEWWTWKLARTQARDRDTDALLLQHGWLGVRVWEHEAVETAADSVERAVKGRT